MFNIYRVCSLIGVLFLNFSAAVLVFSPAQNLKAAEAKADPVVAVVNGFEIHMSAVEQARLQLPPQAQQYPMATVYKFLLDSLINTRLVAAAAR